MKKYIMKTVAFLVALTATLGLASCGGDSSVEEKSVTLVPIADPKTVSPALGYDYYLVAEPLASAKVKGTAGTAMPLHIVGDLQKLYGGENGYPQAVLVARNDFLEENGAWVESFTAEVARSATWLTAETTEITTIVNAVATNLTEGMTPSLTEVNLTKEVIANSGVRFVKASENKTAVNAFLSELIGVSENSAKAVADGFFYEEKGFSQTTVLSESVDIYMPDGAPALSMAKLMSEEMDGCEFHVVNAGTIATFVTGEAPEAELCVLPLNAASKLLGTGTAYTMLGTVTHGNLYLLSTNPTPLDSAEAMKGLAGKRIGTIQIENVPGLTLKLILKKYDLAYTQGA